MRWLFLAMSLVAFAALAFGEREATTCEKKINISGEAEVLGLYRKDNEWLVADPQQIKVREKQIIKPDPGAQLVVLVIREESGKLHSFVYDWHVHGATPQICTH